MTIVRIRLIADNDNNVGLVISSSGSGILLDGAVVYLLNVNDDILCNSTNQKYVPNRL